MCQVDFIKGMGDERSASDRLPGKNQGVPGYVRRPNRVKVVLGERLTGRSG
jgi:hypothetical protein